MTEIALPRYGPCVACGDEVATVIEFVGEAKDVGPDLQRLGDPEDAAGLVVLSLAERPGTLAGGADGFVKFSDRRAGEAA